MYLQLSKQNSYWMGRKVEVEAEEAMKQAAQKKLHDDGARDGIATAITTGHVDSRRRSGLGSRTG
jgi:hypothetical protein